MDKRILSYLTVFLLAAGISNLFAQKYNIKHISTEQGLIQTQISSIVQNSKGEIILGSQGSAVLVYDGKTFTPFQFGDDRIRPENIYSLYKDSKGIIWFCSYNGIAKYDGERVIYYGTDAGLPDPDIITMKEDKNGVYWFGGVKGLIRYDGKFTRIETIGGMPVLKEIRSIAESGDGSLWVTNGAVIQRISKNSIRNFSLPFKVAQNTIRQVFVDSKNRIWAPTINGLFYFENDSFKKYSANSILEKEYILRIHETKGGRLWFSVRDFGVVSYDGKKFEELSQKNGLSTGLIYTVFQDTENNIWFGTDEGLDFYSNNIFIKYDKNSGLEENLVWCVHQDYNKKIWVVTDRAGIFNVDAKGKIIPFEKQKQMNVKQYYNIRQDKWGNLWIATREGMFKYRNSRFEKVIDGGFSNIIEDKNKHLWFGSFEKGFYKWDGVKITQFSEKEGLLKGEALGITIDNDGNTWLSTGTGMMVISKGEMLKFPYSNSLVRKEIIQFKIDSRGGIWAATLGDGLYRLRLNNKKEIEGDRISIKEGLISDFLFLAEEDDFNHLWIGTQLGLAVLMLDDFYKGRIVIKNFNKEDGIPHAEYNQSASLKDDNGILWFGTNKGLIKCDPSRFKLNSVEPLTRIKNFTIFYKKEDLSPYGNTDVNPLLPSDLKLPYDMNHITLEFIGVSLSNPSKVRYKYILENFDKEWRGPTDKNYETYTNLPSGSYTFKVMACNDDGLWNASPVSYSFVINTPYYKTWWFISLSVIAIFLISWLAYDLRMRKIKALNRVLEQSLEEKIEAEKKLLQSEKDYRGLFENAHDAILVIDPVNHIVLEANNEACEMYGYSYEEMINLPFSEITADFDKARQNITDTFGYKGWKNFEIQHVSKYGTPIEIEANANIMNYNGKDAIVAIMHNITERKSIEKALIDSKEQAEKSNLLKSNFLAQMSHEIRTPINTILSYASLLKLETKEKISPELQEGFEVIESGGRRLIRTIDSILNMSQIQTGNQEVFPEKISLYYDILIKLFNELKQTAILKSLDFSIVNNAGWDVIMGDQYSLSQLFINLIDNAIKYTPAGSVTIELENRDKESITVYIKDTGIGMSEDFLPTIFQPFSQEEQGYTRKFEGNGLGLALVKSYCALNSGRIEVTSKKGAGTVFCVTFNLFKA